MDLREIAVQFLVAFLAASFLVACGGGDSGNPVAVTVTPTTTTTKTTTTTTCSRTVNGQPDPACSQKWTCPAGQTCGATCGSCKPI